MFESTTNGVSVSSGEIVLGKRRITADTALRLARYFDMSPQFWVGLLMYYDLDVAEDALARGYRADQPRTGPRLQPQARLCAGLLDRAYRLLPDPLTQQPDVTRERVDLLLGSADGDAEIRQLFDGSFSQPGLVLSIRF